MRREGFTLLEVIVALALSLLLLGSVYSAIHLYWQLSTAGREQMEHAQLVRALFRQIETDIRSTVFPIQKPASTGSQASSGSSMSGEATAEDDQQDVVEITSADDALTGTTAGLYGDIESLMLHTNRPDRDLAYFGVAQATTFERVSDLASVSYFLAIRGAGGLSGAVADASIEPSLLGAPSPGSVRGLARLESDQLVLDFAEQADLESLATSAQLIAPEVVSLTFSYWDGLEWAETWDSEVEGRVPSAIEITIGLRASENSARRSAQGEVSEALGEDETPVAYYRHVVVLPLADPYPEEGAL